MSPFGITIPVGIKKLEELIGWKQIYQKNLLVRNVRWTNMIKIDMPEYLVKRSHQPLANWGHAYCFLETASS